MATFEAQVHALTNIGATLSASTTPTDAQLDQFLKDGVIDVTDRCLAIMPQEIQDFQRVSAIKDSNNNFRVNGARIISVLREANADGSSDASTAWRPCGKISPALESRVVDTDSLDFASIYNPAYMIADDGYVNVYPAPDGSDDGFKVYYVNNVPVDKSGAALLHSHSDIGYFADNKVYLVILYASIQALTNALSAKVIASDISFPVTPGSPTLPAVPNALTLASAPVGFVLPDMPADANVDFLGVASSPVFSAQLISLTSVPALSWSLPSSVAAPALNTEAFTLPSDPTPVTPPGIITPQLAIDEFPTDISWTFPAIPVAPTL
nr:hypothetical protein [Paracoccaceae bacterium]